MAEKVNMKKTKSVAKAGSHIVSTASSRQVKVMRKNAAQKTLAANAVISESDVAMDIRAKEAITVAVKKAKVCNKPIAKYDKETKRAYLEYADGGRKYID